VRGRIDEGWLNSWNDRLDRWPCLAEYSLGKQWHQRLKYHPRPRAHPLHPGCCSHVPYSRRERSKLRLKRLVSSLTVTLSISVFQWIPISTLLQMGISAVCDVSQPQCRSKVGCNPARPSGPEAPWEEVGMGFSTIVSCDLREKRILCKVLEKTRTFMSLGPSQRPIKRALKLKA
jgi:hypothetical protein